MSLPEHQDPTQISGDWDDEALRLARKLHADLLRCRAEQVVNTMHLSMLDAMRYATGTRSLANERISRFVQGNIEKAQRSRDNEAIQKKLS